MGTLTLAGPGLWRLCHPTSAVQAAHQWPQGKGATEAPAAQHLALLLGRAPWARGAVTEDHSASHVRPREGQRAPRACRRERGEERVGTSGLPRAELLPQLPLLSHPALPPAPAHRGPGLTLPALSAPPGPALRGDLAAPSQHRGSRPSSLTKPSVLPPLPPAHSACKPLLWHLEPKEWHSQPPTVPGRKHGGPPAGSHVLFPDISEGCGSGLPNIPPVPLPVPSWSKARRASAGEVPFHPPGSAGAPGPLVWACIRQLLGS